MEYSAMDYQYKLGIYIGRFQPFHNGHRAVVYKALETCEHIRIVVGSAGLAPSSKNPFSFQQRRGMIILSFPQAIRDRISIVSQRDFDYNENLWLSQIMQHAQGEKNTAIIGHNKDESSYYLSKFKEWKFLEVENFEQLNATDVRECLYKMIENDEYPDVYDDLRSSLEEMVPANVFEELIELVDEGNTRIVEALAQREAINNYKKSWASAPFPPVFVTGDAVVVQGAHVLLIQRGGDLGYGQWAIPGGFINQDESVEDCIIRELMEETKIKVPEKVLKGSIKGIKYFDHPKRSLRGRSITFAGLIELDDSLPLPKVTAADDAMKAWWHPISDIPSASMFEDHYQILTDILKINQ